MNIWDNNALVNTLKDGGVVVMPTDTIYGIAGSALSKDIVERIYRIKNRNPEKPFIVLLASKEQAKETLELTLELILEQDEPTTFIVPFQNNKFEYLTRGKDSLAIRIPRDQGLRDLISKTGPLVAPSANPEGKAPAKNIDEAKEYFGGEIDFYLDGGEVVGQASQIIELKADGSQAMIRE